MQGLALIKVIGFYRVPAIRIVIDSIIGVIRVMISLLGLLGFREVSGFRLYLAFVCSAGFKLIPQCQKLQPRSSIGQGNPIQLQIPGSLCDQASERNLLKVSGYWILC